MQCNNYVYNVASSARGQDESNPALWLATQVGKMEPSCPLGTTRLVPQEKFHRKPYMKSFIDQACSVKLAWYWPRSFFACLWTSTPSRSMKTLKKNLANIQSSRAHTWSIAHTCMENMQCYLHCSVHCYKWLLPSANVVGHGRHVVPDACIETSNKWGCLQLIKHVWWHNSWNKMVCKLIKGGKFLKKLWCRVGGSTLYYKIIWFYQLGW